MKGRIVIITGANSGIGRTSLEKFIAAGDHVIMACRNSETSQRTLAETRQKFPSAAIDLLTLDLASFKSIEEFTAALKKKTHRVDVMIHNAGAFNHGITQFQKTEDGLELTYQVNVLSPALLNRKISPLLAKSKNPHIIYASTTNIKYFFDPQRNLDLDDILPNDRPYNSYKMYGDSKMAQLAFMLACAAKTPEIKTGAVMIPSVKLSPESIAKTKGYFRYIARIQNLFARPREGVAEGYYALANSEQTGVLLNYDRERVTPVTPARNPLTQIKYILNDKFCPDLAWDRDFQDMIFARVNYLLS